MLCEFSPASGSVIANAIVIEPSAIPGSHRCFCSSVPLWAMMVAQMAGETTSSSSGAPAAASSSHTMASSVMPAPPPPYCSGVLTPMKPEAGGLLPQLGGHLVLACLGQPVVDAELGPEFGDRRAQRQLFGGLGEVHGRYSSARAARCGWMFPHTDCYRLVTP